MMSMFIATKYQMLHYVPQVSTRFLDFSFPPTSFEKQMNDIHQKRFPHQQIERVDPSAQKCSIHKVHQDELTKAAHANTSPAPSSVLRIFVEQKVSFRSLRIQARSPKKVSRPRSLTIKGKKRPLAGKKVTRCQQMRSGTHNILNGAGARGWGAAAGPT